jgi:calcium-dependent protein kinase
VKRLRIHRSSEAKMNQVVAELQCSLYADHPHIVRLHDAYECEKYVYLVMECMEGGDLHGKVKERRHFSEEEACNALHQMLLALNYLHAHGVVHRDVKLENFVYAENDSSHLKLIDFGFSTAWNCQSVKKLSQPCGTHAYCAPEVFRESYTSQCDMWSLGVVGYILLSGCMPFSGSQHEQTLSIRTGSYAMSEGRWAAISPNAKDFIQSLLRVDPANRLTVKQALDHAWIRSRPMAMTSELSAGSFASTIRGDSVASLIHNSAHMFFAMEI